MSAELEKERNGLEGVRAFSADTDNDHVLRVLFDHRVTDADRAALLDMHNRNVRLEAEIEALRKERDEARAEVGRKHDEANRYVNEMLDAKRRAEAAKAIAKRLREAALVAQAALSDGGFQGLLVDAALREIDAALSASPIGETDG